MCMLQLVVTRTCSALLHILTCKVHTDRMFSDVIKLEVEKKGTFWLHTVNGIQNYFPG